VAIGQQESAGKQVAVRQRAGVIAKREATRNLWFVFDLSTTKIARCAGDGRARGLNQQFSFSGSKQEITVSRHATREHILETTWQIATPLGCI
jgi:hypothetical protein